MTDKKRNNSLILMADEAIRATGTLFENGRMTIDPAYNGQIAAFGVMIAMTGLKPAFCLYFQDKENPKVSRKKIIKVLAHIISDDPDFSGRYSDEKELYRSVVTASGAQESKLKKEILDCLTALKQVVRTYLNE